MRTLTLVVPTYRRREAVARLLRLLAGQLGGAAGAGVEVVVVVDGSRDGSLERVRELDYPVPLTALWQENAGLAAARNAGLGAARGELVWFLDDDMVPADDLVERHRRAHEGGGRSLAMGASLVPPEADVIPQVRAWAELRHEELRRAGTVSRAVWFSAANTSGPAETWRAAGGFDPGFTGWGGEDYELAVRLLAAGVPIRYEPDAVAWHGQERGIREFCRTRREQGRNFVRIVRKHPDALEELLPARAAARLERALGSLPLARPLAYRLLARVAAEAAEAERLATRGRGGRLFRHATALSLLAGVAAEDEDGRLTARLLGHTDPPA